MYKYLLYFLIFSFFGLCVEVLFHAAKCGRFVNRGLARGPVCPIYGVGICLSAILLSSVRSFTVLALLSMAIATAVELAVGFFTDRMLGLRLWDYTCERGNILGYVCPRFSLIWGVVCATVIKLLPLFDPVISLLDNPVAYGISFTLLMILLLDVKNEMIRGKSKRTIRLNEKGS
jgi:uncharacterized membrane protein